LPCGCGVECRTGVDDKDRSLDVAGDGTRWIDFNAPLAFNIAEEAPVNLQFAGPDIRMNDCVFTHDQNIIRRDGPMEAPSILNVPEN
jgi:hypothetical protein